jgi:hypothetical protein
MPIDSILVSAGVVAMFVVFAGALMWGDRQTRSGPVGAGRRHHQAQQ